MTRSATLARRAGRPANPSAAISLLSRAEDGLVLAAWESDPDQRYVAAHLAALRAAAAVLAARGRPRRGSGTLNVWQVLPRVAPELEEWAVFFAAGAAARSQIDSGRVGVVTTRQADDLLRDAQNFITVVTDELGL